VHWIFGTWALLTINGNLFGTIWGFGYVECKDVNNLYLVVYIQNKLSIKMESKTESDIDSILEMFFLKESFGLILICCLLQLAISTGTSIGHWISVLLAIIVNLLLHK
jgi:hypothetical protein